jgi:hypothetical protein
MVRLTLAAALLFAVAAGIAVADDTERIEGVVIAVHPNDFVLDGTGRLVVVDMSALGGVTAAIAVRQPVAVIGKMAPDGQRFIAHRLEAVKSPTSGQR